MKAAVLSRISLLALVVLAAQAQVSAQVPGEVQDLDFSGDGSTFQWIPVTGADFYNIYRGQPGHLAKGLYGECHGTEIGVTSFTTPEIPELGQVFNYLVTGESSSAGEGTLGFKSGLVERPLLGGCTKALRGHVQNRLGYGTDAWTRSRLDLLGLQGFMDEQLDPASISELDNTALNNGLAAYDPPASVIDLIARMVVGHTYARRQLEQQMATFWANHFNTYSVTITGVFQGVYPDCNIFPANPACDPAFPNIAVLESAGAQHREIETFRGQSFGGSFRDMLGTSARSPAMIIYLDGYLNKVGAPNENHAREILELHALGVNGGYTQTDVEELARVMTGWGACKKELAQLNDPLAACISNYWLPAPAGQWTGNFTLSDHDCGAKTLFLGTPQEVSFPGTASCSTGTDAAVAMAEFEAALDAIAGHSSTARFIARKLLQLLVTEEPPESMIDVLVAEWNNSGNPAGAGDIREILRAALYMNEFLDLASVPGKIKTPLEHFVSAFRALKGNTDGVDQVLFYLLRTQHLPFYNLVPTGYSELGGDWIDTNNMLERQNFGVLLIASASATFGSFPVQLLSDNGISTAPGNAQGIVEFYNDILFAGSLTAAEKQYAIDYLLTTDDGVPDPNYDDLRIRGAVGLMLGFAQFQNQ